MNTTVCIRLLPVSLSEAEVNDRARELATVCAARREVEAEKRRANLAFTERLNALQARLDELSECVTTMTEKRDVVCRWNFIPAENLAVLQRCDTGETVKTRPMTEAEMQLVLPEMEAARVFAAEREAEEAR